MSRIERQNQKTTTVNFSYSYENEQTGFYDTYHYYTFNVPNLCISKIRFIGTYYSSSLSGADNQALVTLYYTDGTNQSYWLYFNSYRRNGESYDSQNFYLGIDKPVASINIRIGAKKSYTIIKTDSIEIDTYTVQKYYDLTIADCLVDSSKNVLENTTRSKTEYKEGVKVNVSHLPEHSEKEYEIYSSLDNNSASQQSITLNQDIIITWYYKRRYSKNIFVNMTKKLIDTMLKYNVSFLD